MQDGIMSKEITMEKTQISSYNSWWFGLPFISCVYVVTNLGYEIPKGYLEKLYNILMGLTRDFLN